MTDNIIHSFPSSKIVRSSHEIEIEQGDEKVKRKAAIEDAMLTVDEELMSNENVRGVVVLLFEDGEVPTCKDWFAGDLALSEVYVMLDRIKQDIIKIIEASEEPKI